MPEEIDSFKWVEELLATPPDVRRILKERTTTYLILGKEAEKFVGKIFKKLGYDVIPHFRKENMIFDFLARKKDENLLVEVKLRGRVAQTAMFRELFHRIERVDKEYGFYLVTFDRSNDVKEHNLDGHQRYTFIKSGNIGTAFSEPGIIEGVILLEEIDRMFEKRIEFKSNTDFIFSLSKVIAEVIEDSPDEFKEGYFSIMESIRIPDNELKRSVIHILTFTFMANITWGIGYS